MTEMAGWTRRQDSEACLLGASLSAHTFTHHTPDDLSIPLKGSSVISTCIQGHSQMVLCDIFAMVLYRYLFHLFISLTAQFHPISSTERHPTPDSKCCFESSV